MASSSKSASASASTSTADDNTYYAFDVFLNHRGPDGKPFAISLYNRLKDHAHLRVFLDRDELEKGEELTAQIEGAIRASSVNIAIFSPRYCESEWCLKELVLMLECKRTKRSTILPIFFHVKPSVVKWTQDKYGEALSSLQKKRNRDDQLRYKPEIIGKWKEALHDVAEIIGYELDEEPYNGDESKLLTDVVENVLKLVPKPPLPVSIYPTGLEEKVKDLDKKVLLQQHESGKAKVVGIVGLGGIGKTTLAKELYNRKNKEYRRSSFLFHVRENDSRGELKKLQRQLIKELSGKDTEINSTDEGIPLLKKHLPHWHALIVLDDVDAIEQLRALLPVLPAKDSLILITSRDKSVLQIWELIEDSFIYTVEGLSLQHSVELFCGHAFRLPGPPDAVFEQLVNKFVDACGKLPLSLCVIGALLRGKNPKQWEEQLRKIRKTLPTQIQKILEISYESLDDEEKKLFLDVACFFIGAEKDTAMMIWEDSGWAASLGLETLRNKHLVEVEVDAVRKDRVEYVPGLGSRGYYIECMVECIRMHDQLRDMGRYLADKEPSLRRSWSVTENLSDLSPVEGMTRDSAERDRRVRELRWRWLDGPDLPASPGSCVEGVFNVEQPPQLIFLRCYNCPDSSLAPNISTKNLRVLHIKGSNLETLWHLDSQAPRELRELYIAGSRLPKIPQSIGQLRRLEKVALWSERNIVSFETLPDEFCQLQSLKHLELHENGLKSLPESFGDLSSLQHLNLADCRCLEKLPDSFGNLTNLQHIDLCSCHRLQTLPNTFGNLIQLKFLSLAGCWLNILNEALRNITTLEHLDLSCSELPSSIGNLSNLKILCVESYDLEMLPSSFGALRSLEELTFEWCAFKCFPDSIRMLTQLRKLVLRDMVFKRLKIKEWLSGLPTTLKTLEIWGRKEMEELEEPEELEEMEEPEESEELEELSGLERLESLEEEPEEPEESEELEELSGLERLESLEEEPEELEELSGLERLESLEDLEIGLERLESLEDLEIVSCDGLKRIHGLAQLTKLQRLNIESNRDLEELPGIEGSQSLKEVNACSCPKLKRKLEYYVSSHRTCRYHFFTGIEI